MTAIVAYMKAFANGRPVGSPTPDRSAGHMAELTRAADPVRGKDVHAQSCAACHGADGAGMARLIGAANFTRSNLPNGVNWQSPVLSEQDAWDVAAYMESQPRPQKPHLERDYPVTLERLVDSNYGLYADGLSAEQHKLRPSAPIRARVSELRAVEPVASAKP